MTQTRRPVDHVRVAHQQRRDFRAGARAIAPLDPGAFVFGLALGAFLATSSLNPWVGASSSVTMLSGAAQFAMMDLLNSSVPALIAIGTALVINARFALYSAALGPIYAQFPWRWRLLLPQFMTDQAAAIQLRDSHLFPDPVRKRWYFLGAGLTFGASNWLGTAAGVVLGPVIPGSWQINFIVPLMFIALLIPTLRNRPALVAAFVSIAMVVLLRELPYGLNVLAGALVGIAAGRVIPLRPEDQPKPLPGEEETP